MIDECILLGVAAHHCLMLQSICSVRYPITQKSWMLRFRSLNQLVFDDALSGSERLFSHLCSRSLLHLFKNMCAQKYGGYVMARYTL